MHVKDHFELTISLDYMSKVDYRDFLEEQERTRELLKDSVPDRPQRSGFDEL